MNKRNRKFFVLKSTKNQNTRPGDTAPGKSAAEITACSDIITEAERIVDKYMENMGYTACRVLGKKKKKKAVPTVCVIIGVFFAAVYTVIKII